jgi:hypothetical protein
MVRCSYEAIAARGKPRAPLGTGVLRCAATYDFSGISVNGAGDVDGDDIDDLIIGAPLADPNSRNYAGASYIVFGTDQGFPAIIGLAVDADLIIQRATALARPKIPLTTDPEGRTLPVIERSGRRCRGWPGADPSSIRPGAGKPWPRTLVAASRAKSF